MERKRRVISHMNMSQRELGILSTLGGFLNPRHKFSRFGHPPIYINRPPKEYNRVDDTFSMVHRCADCGQKFLSRSEYNRHRSTHLQTHLDKWGATDKLTWKAPDGMNPALYKVFEKYNLGDKVMLCLWVNGQLNTAIRERSRVLELQDRLREWLQEL